MKNIVYRIGKKCVKCGKCQKVCKKDCIKKGNPYVIDEKKCVKCGKCADKCPKNAILQIKLKPQKEDITPMPTSQKEAENHAATTNEVIITIEKEIAPKKITDSFTEQIQIVMPEHINGANRLFGGRLIEWVDITAAVVARRHSGCDVTTAAVDNLQFKAPAYVNDTIVLKGRITHVANSSMEVRVDSYVENLNGKKDLINVAYLVLVALDKNETPVKVADIICETREDKEEYERAILRYKLRQANRKN